MWMKTILPSEMCREDCAVDTAAHVCHLSPMGKVVPKLANLKASPDTGR